MKFEFIDLNYLWFDTKHVQFGWHNSHGLQTAIYYEVTSCSRSYVRYVVFSEVTQALEQELRAAELIFQYMHALDT